MKYTIIIEKTNTGYSAYSPDLPGCISTGRTLEEIKKNMTEAVELHIEDMKLQHHRPPKPVSIAELVEV